MSVSSSSFFLKHTSYGHPSGGPTPDEQCVSLPSSHPLAELIGEYCDAPNGTMSPQAALRIAHFAMDLFIQQQEQMLREAEPMRRPPPTQDFIRRLGIARTVRRKVARLNRET